MAGPRYERVLAEVCGEPWSGRGLGGMLSYSTVVYTLVLAQNHLKLQQNIRDLLPSRPFYGTKAWEENSAGLIWKTMYTCVIQFQILATHLSVNHYIGIHATISSATTALHARLYLWRLSTYIPLCFERAWDFTTLPHCSHTTRAKLSLAGSSP